MQSSAVSTFESGHRLLIVDDEPDFAAFIGEVAKDVGFETEVVLDGKDFVESYKAFRPKIIFLDLNLPNMDGIEILRFLGTESCKAGIYITSGTDSRTISTAAAIGIQHNLNVVGKLAKPLSFDDVANALEPFSVVKDAFGPDEIRKALAALEIKAFYQPKMDILNGSSPRLVGVESLVRWVRADGAKIDPDDFLPAVSAHGLMPDLTDVVMSDTLASVRYWMDKGVDISASINLDGTMLDNLLLPDELHKKVVDAGVDPEQITFEITESAAMSNVDATMDILTRLRVKNFSVSIDDFGTGYSSLVQLYRLPFNELKIDKSFVIEITQNEEAQIIVEALASLAKKLGLKVCAEGIETDSTLARVKSYGCDLGQGYLFSKPVDRDAIVSLHQKWNA